MEKECIFCRIAAGEIPCDMVYQDEDFVAFRDIEPQAPIHVLVIPRSHIPSLSEFNEEQLGVVGRLVNLAKKLAIEEKVDKSGYRLVINCGVDGGQFVPHVHLHLIGGSRLSAKLG